MITLVIITGSLSGVALGDETSPALAASLASRQALQQSLQRELQQLKEREAQAQDAIKHARLSQHQLKLEKLHQRHLQQALLRTQTRLTSLTRLISRLTAHDSSLEHEENQKTIEMAQLLPTLQQLNTAPETPLLLPSETSPAGPENDPALIFPLLTTQIRLTQQKLTQLEHQRRTLHQRQTQLDRTSQYIEKQRLLQQKQQALEASQKEQIERMHQADEQAVLQARSLLEKSRQNMQSLTNAIEQLARREEAERRRLKAEARRLRQAHKKAKARQAEQAARNLSAGNGVAKGQGAAPVQGTLLIHWGENTEAGPSTGLTYRTNSAVTVSAPCSGRLLFTGDFRSFGPMVILDCGHSQRFVLAGLGQIVVHSDQPVKRNALLGYMPSHGGDLFVQFRQGSHITNPTPFLTSSP
ncbi:peptidoglycan DD-metalloendopeptidase family protein [Saccharibacter sp. 17.LH.SD]|uniref:murein hydrolase activator EnvC family protein n=1 Tax=Saccharibacter sp. 17.LH.SD TaxID=2689393 RepID=UPI001367C99C|nr:peptidoglycan DD-metalloendopeptidase family protein [Saccharibacter sp. 17.LH.SD]